MAAMPHELKVKSLEGGVVTIEVMQRTTIRELKAMLHEQKHCEDPIERKILKVKVVADGLLVDDDQTMESAGLLHAESEVTVIYSRNEVEAATKEAIHTQGLLQANMPSSLTEISAWAFHGCHQVVKVAIPKSVTAIRHAAFHDCKSLVSITIPASVMTIGHSAFSRLQFSDEHQYPWLCDGYWGLCLLGVHFFGKHHNPRVCDGYWGLCLCRLQVFDKHGYPSFCEGHWGQCLWRLQFFEKHHNPRVGHSHRGRCLCRLQIFDTHHNPWVFVGLRACFWWWGASFYTVSLNPFACCHCLLGSQQPLSSLESDQLSIINSSKDMIENHHSYFSFFAPHPKK